MWLSPWLDRARLSHVAWPPMAQWEASRFMGWPSPDRTQHGEEAGRWPGHQLQADILTAWSLAALSLGT